MNPRPSGRLSFRFQTSDYYTVIQQKLCQVIKTGGSRQIAVAGDLGCQDRLVFFVNARILFEYLFKDFNQIRIQLRPGDFF